MASPSRTIPCLLSLVVTGCVVGPEPRAPTPESLGVPAQFNADIAAAAGTTAELARWWSTFDDATLVLLVERALDANTDIDIAGARVRQARAAWRGTRAAWWPWLDAGASAARQIDDTDAAPAGERTSYAAGIDAAYEVDVFGGVRRSVQASAADLSATLADLDVVRLTIAAEVALTYIDARLAQRRLALARANLAAQDETLQIVGWRVQAGLVGSLDLEQARQLRAQTAAAIPQLEQDYFSAAHRLGVLLGENPAALLPMLASAAGIPLASLPPVAIPSDVMRRRPDVARAERALVAETALIGVREADLYPALRLTGSFGGSGTSLDEIADASIGNIVAGLTAPIFQGGRLRAAVEGQRAAADGALADYRGTILTALEEVENSLVAVMTAERRELELVNASEAARNATVIARSQYQAGLIDFQLLLEAERSLLTTDDSRATARASRAAAQVQLYKALGGGWDATAVAP